MAQTPSVMAAGLSLRANFQNHDAPTDVIAAKYLTDDTKTALLEGSGVDQHQHTGVALEEGREFIMNAWLLDVCSSFVSELIET